MPESATDSTTRTVYRITAAGRVELTDLLRVGWGRIRGSYPRDLYTLLTFAESLPRTTLPGGLCLSAVRRPTAHIRLCRIPRVLGDRCPEQVTDTVVSCNPVTRQFGVAVASAELRADMPYLLCCGGTRSGVSEGECLFGVHAR
jgi:hypothetical protein